jgi:hypothetical protein
MGLRLTTALAAASLALCSSQVARAHGGGADLSAAPTPPSPPGEGREAERLLDEVAKATKAEPKLEAVVSEPVREARRSLERARGARVSGDDRHARMLDALAKEHAELARDRLNRVATEERAREAEKKLALRKAQNDRARALVTEMMARAERARAELEKAVAEAEERSRAARAAEDERLQKGGKKGGPAPKAAAPKAPAPKGKR